MHVKQNIGRGPILKKTTVKFNIQMQMNEYFAIVR